MATMPSKWFSTRVWETPLGNMIICPPSWVRREGGREGGRGVSAGTYGGEDEGGREGTYLVVGGVDGFPHEFIQGLEARQNDRGIGALLDGAMAEADEVGPNADCAPHDELEGGREGGRKGGRVNNQN